MFKTGDYVVYKRDVCVIKEIKKNYFHNQDYFCLEPVFDSTLKINVPVENEQENLRSLISLEEVKEIINRIPLVEVIETDDKNLENDYKQLLHSEKIDYLIKIIKTAYLRNKDRINNNKKIGEKDNNYFNLAERYLYTEFSIVLNKNFEDTKDYVIEKVMEIEAQ